MAAVRRSPSDCGETGGSLPSLEQAFLALVQRAVVPLAGRLESLEAELRGLRGAIDVVAHRPSTPATAFTPLPGVRPAGTTNSPLLSPAVPRVASASSPTSSPLVGRTVLYEPSQSRSRVGFGAELSRAQTRTGGELAVSPCPSDGNTGADTAACTAECSVPVLPHAITTGNKRDRPGKAEEGVSDDQAAGASATSEEACRPEESGAAPCQTPLQLLEAQDSSKGSDGHNASDKKDFKPDTGTPILAHAAVFFDFDSTLSTPKYVDRAKDYALADRPGLCASMSRQEILANFGGPGRVARLHALLQRLGARGVALFIVSLGFTETIRYQLSSVGLGRFFPAGHIFGQDSADLAQARHRKAVLIQRLKELNSWPQERVLFVDDDESHVSLCNELSACQTMLVRGDGLSLDEMERIEALAATWTRPS
eukprot:TRINITY_DN15580_c0_g1_i1.p1 TRINITY_DN15580_c0_g1~~TRINITY_DN15580_c0_g1_i1.p1  ORF type:complete len:433 (-),score=72.78 TRINITY_DN15580_c0_g1_i1:161-1435(-)